MDFQTFSMSIGRLSGNIEDAQRRNAEKERLGALLNEQTKLWESAKSLKHAYDYGLKLIAQVSLAYKDARKEALEENVENSLELAFPDEHFKMRIEYDTRGKQQLATLLIGKVQPNGEVKWGSPHCRSGDFAKQLISLCIVAEIALMLGCESVFADEPLSNGDSISLAEIRPFFERLSANGLQTIFIEHEEEMYTGLERQEIILEKNRSLGCVRVISNSREVANYDGESESEFGTEHDATNEDVPGGDVTSDGDTSSRAEGASYPPDSGGIFEDSGQLLLE